MGRMHRDGSSRDKKYPLKLTQLVEASSSQQHSNNPKEKSERKSLKLGSSVSWGMFTICNLCLKFLYYSPSQFIKRPVYRTTQE